MKYSIDNDYNYGIRKDKPNCYEPIEHPPLLHGDQDFTLEEGLFNFFRSHHIGKEYYCKNCNKGKYHKTSEAVRRTLFLNLPKNLIINVRRFKHGYYGIEKDNTKVKFNAVLFLDRYTLHRADSYTLDQIDYFKDVTSNKEGAINVYDLYGVVTHQGSMAAGHYTCYVSSIVDKRERWYEFDFVIRL